MVLHRLLFVYLVYFICSGDCVLICEMKNKRVQNAQVLPYVGRDGSMYTSWYWPVLA